MCLNIFKIGITQAFTEITINRNRSFLLIGALLQVLLSLQGLPKELRP